MAALTMTVPTAAGTTVTPNTPTASDTISATQLGTQGCNVRIQTTGTSSNVSFSDSGATPSGNPGTVTPVAMGATAVKIVYVSPAQVNLATGNVTITSTAQAGMTYEVYPA